MSHVRSIDEYVVQGRRSAGYSTSRSSILSVARYDQMTSEASFLDRIENIRETLPLLTPERRKLVGMYLLMGRQNPLLEKMLAGEDLMEMYEQMRTPIEEKTVSEGRFKGFYHGSPISEETRESFRALDQLVKGDSSYLDSMPIASTQNLVALQWFVPSVAGFFAAADYIIDFPLIFGPDKSYGLGAASIGLAIAGIAAAYRSLKRNNAKNPAEEHEGYKQRIRSFQNYFSEFVTEKLRRDDSLPEAVKAEEAMNVDEYIRQLIEDAHFETESQAVDFVAAVDQLTEEQSFLDRLENIVNFPEMEASEKRLTGTYLLTARANSLLERMLNGEKLMDIYQQEMKAPLEKSRQRSKWNPLKKYLEGWYFGKGLSSEVRQSFRDLDQLVGGDSSYLRAVPISSMSNLVSLQWLVPSIFGLIAAVDSTVVHEYLGPDKSLIMGGVSAIMGLIGLKAAYTLLKQNNISRPGEESDAYEVKIQQFQDLFDRVVPLTLHRELAPTGFTPTHQT